DEIESEGVRRALERAERADLKLVLFEAGRPPPPEAQRLLDADALPVLSKIDLAPGADRSAGLAVSTVTGEGLAELRAALEREAARRLDAGSAPALTRARHR